MLPVTIRDHSPMDDYRKIQSQIRYTVQYAPYTDTEKPDCKEKLTSNRNYNTAYRIVITFLILTGIGIVVSIVAGIIFANDSFSDVERKMLAIMILVTCASLGISLLICGVAAPMELRAEIKDREIAISLDNITWILNNGQIVISDEQKYRSVQLYDYNTRLPISEAPFKKMQIIHKVYAIACVNGKIMADADIRELYRKHPYTNEGPTRSEEEDSGRYYYYCQKDKREKVFWYENMYGRERLLEALNRLKA